MCPCGPPWCQPHAPRAAPRPGPSSSWPTAFGPGVNGPLTVLFDGPGAAAAAATAASGPIAGLPDVAAVVPADARRRDARPLLTVHPELGPDQPATERPRARRCAGCSAATDGAGPTSPATPLSASTCPDSSTHALPVYLALVVGLALVLLVLVFRSLLVPLVGVLGFLLTIGAAARRHGRGVPVGLAGGAGQPDAHRAADQPHADPGHRHPVRAGDGLPGLPGLPHARGAQPRDGAAGGDPDRVPAGRPGGGRGGGDHVLGLRRLRARGDATIKSIAFALAPGSLFDAFVVRMVIVPAALALLGERAWWLPRWLRWLPALDVEGAALERHGLPPERELAPAGAGPQRGER